jgi:hypothetical protein
LKEQVIGAEGFQWFINRYYSAAGTLYLTITGPPVDIHVIANLQPTTAPTTAQQFIANLVKDDLLIEILSKLAIKKILGSLAGTNKQLQEIFDKNEEVILQILEKQRTLNLPEATMPLSQVPHTIESNFKTIG